MDFQQMMVLSQFDDRGARIVWKARRVRLAGEVLDGISMNSPTWVSRTLKPHLKSRGARRVNIKSTKGYWLDSYVLPDGLDPELRELLDLLANVCSIGRVTADVDINIALDLYKAPVEGVDPTDWPDTTVGGLVKHSKYRRDPGGAFDQLVTRLAAVFRDHPDYRNADAVVSVPGTRANVVGHGERLARIVADHVEMPFVRTLPTYSERAPAKQGFSMTSEHVTIPANLAAMSVVVVDDVIRSGRSISAVAGAAKAQGAERVLSLVAAKTLRN